MIYLRYKSWRFIIPVYVGLVGMLKYFLYNTKGIKPIIKLIGKNIDVKLIK